MRKYVKSNDGYALVIALLVITVVTVLGLGILTTTSSSKKLSEEENKDQTAYYIAEAGLNQKKEELKIAKDVYDKFVEDMKDQKLTKEQFVSKLRTFAEGRLSDQLKPIEYGANIFNRKNAKANVKTVMNVSETELKFTITSTGIIKSTDSANEKKRTVQSVDSYNLNISDNGKEFGEYAAYMLGNLKVNSHASISGKIGFYTKPTNIPAFRDKLFIGKNNFEYEPFNFEKAVENGDIILNDKEIPYKDFPENEFNLYKNNIWDTNIFKTAPSNSEKKISNGDYLKNDYLITSNSFTNDSKYYVQNTTNIFIDKIQDKKLTFSGDGTINLYFSSNSPLNNVDIDFDRNKVNFISLDKFDINDSVNLKNAEVINFYCNNLVFQNKYSIANVQTVNAFANNEILFDPKNSTSSIQYLNLKTKNMSLGSSENAFSTSPKQTNMYIHNNFKANSSILKYNNFNLFYKGNDSSPILSGVNSSLNLDFLYSFISIDKQKSGVIVIRDKNNKWNANKYNKNLNSEYSNLHLYVPTLDLRLGGNGDITGSLYSKTLDMVGNSKITYTTPPPNNILKSSSSGGGNNGSISSDISKNPDSGSIEVNNP